MQVLAGAPRLHDAVSIGEALRRRGFAQVDLGSGAGAAVFSFGEDHSLNMRQRSDGDPFGEFVGLAQRIAVTPTGLVMTHGTEAMRRTLESLAGRAPSLAEIDGVRALLAGLAEAQDAQVVQAIALPLVAGAGNPAAVAALGGPPMPVWVAALLAELAAPPDRPRQRVVLALLDPDGSDAVPAAARAALEARLAVGAGPRPYGIASVEMRVLPQRFGILRVLVADFHLAPGTPPAAGPLAAWWFGIGMLRPVPITFDASARAAALAPPGVGQRQ